MTNNAIRDNIFNLNDLIKIHLNSSEKSSSHYFINIDDFTKLLNSGSYISELNYVRNQDTGVNALRFKIGEDQIDISLDTLPLNQPPLVYNKISNNSKLKGSAQDFQTGINIEGCFENAHIISCCHNWTNSPYFITTSNVPILFKSFDATGGLDSCEGTYLLTGNIGVIVDGNVGVNQNKAVIKGRVRSETGVYRNLKNNTDINISPNDELAIVSNPNHSGSYLGVNSRNLHNINFFIIMGNDSLNSEFRYIDFFINSEQSGNVVAIAGFEFNSIKLIDKQIRS